MPSEAIKYLYDLELFGIKLGLENISALCRSLGNPHNKFRSVHIAGTNGKGSTAAILESILLAAGYRVGLYTSPHLVRFNERIRVNRQEIPDAHIESFVRGIRPQIEERKATFFEATTALAFRYFADEKVDIAVIETGLGGRLDATNILAPKVAVITGIDFDHTDRLGTDLASIAKEKAGIIKPQTPVVIGKLETEASAVIVETVMNNGSSLVSAPAVARLRHLESGWGGSRFGVSAEFSPSGEIFLYLAGRHQGENLASALAAVDVLRQGGFNISSDACRAGAASVRWPARLELISENPAVVLDAAHNPGAAARLAEALKQLWKGKVAFLVGILGDKDYGRFLEALQPLASRFWFVRPDSKRALEPEKLAEAVGSRVSSEVIPDPAAAFWKAYASLGPEELLLVTGSHYVVGSVLEAWQKSGRPYPLTSRREPESVILC
jgi:dihydrofolate synthase/folylpolyglutamate synthase